MNLFRRIALAAALALLPASAGAVTITGDCVINDSGVITCGYSNGVAFGSAAFLGSSAFLQPGNNLSDVASVSAARSNLGLGTAATANLSAVLQTSNNLSDLTSASTARTNLGLGTAATANASAFLAPSNNLSDVNSVSSARSNLGFAQQANANIIDNGDSNIDQRNEGSAVYISTGVIDPDRWISTWVPSTSGSLSPQMQQVSASGCSYFIGAAELSCFKWNPPATAATSTPISMLGFTGQYVEGGTIADLQYGTSTALPLTVSIYHRAGGGIPSNSPFGVALLNAAGNRSFVHECVTNNTTDLCTFSVPGDIGGSWESGNASTNNVVGMKIVPFVWACGASYQTSSPDTWQSGAYYCTSAQYQFVSSTLGAMYVGPVKVERGTTATPFIPDSPSVAYAKAQRCYAKTFPFGTAPAQNAGIAGAIFAEAYAATAGDVYAIWNFPVKMTSMINSKPKIVTYNPAASNANWRDVTGSSDVTVSVDPDTAVGDNGVPIAATSTGLSQGHHLYIHATADAGC